MQGDEARLFATACERVDHSRAESIEIHDHRGHEHRDLLEAAGLKFSNIYYANDSFSESVIEAMVA
jgi:hypothetical protein